MDYEESREYLKSLSRFGINLGLERIKELLRRLGSPEKSGFKIIHITGTNGKGSTSAILYSILREAGIKTGLFTSPHLYSYRERFSFDGCLITEEETAELMTEIAFHLEEMKKEGFETPTEFEVNTALALLFFQRSRARWVILEAGMGGSIDSTNAADGDIAIITNVAMDHMQYLGNTVAEIAKIKAGIIKTDALVFTAAEGDALEIIKEEAKRQHADLKILSKDFSYHFCCDTKEGQAFSLSTSEMTYPELTLPLLGRHQLINASLAVMAAETIGIGADVIRCGLNKSIWPGRLEIVGHNPLIVMDGAHNCHGIEALSKALKLYWPQKKKTALLTMLEDKEREKALNIILPHLDRVVITKPPLREGDWQALAQIVEMSSRPYLVIEDIKEAYHKALSQTKEDELLIIFGSLFLVAEVGKIIASEAERTRRTR